MIATHNYDIYPQGEYDAPWEDETEGYAEGYGEEEYGYQGKENYESIDKKRDYRNMERTTR